jgi:hypothetical protein
MEIQRGTQYVIKSFVIFCSSNNYSYQSPKDSLLKSYIVSFLLLNNYRTCCTFWLEKKAYLAR